MIYSVLIGFGFLGYWDEPQHRREFFIELASKLGFDPQDFQSWSLVKRSDVEAKKVSTPFRTTFSSYSLLFF